MLLTDPIPGQEQRNSEYLLEWGAARRLYDPADAPAMVNRLLDDPATLAYMRTCVERIGRPHAARDIVRDILAR
jgi:processive 1,2-diacylglycerol beta-glucosyltransferase